MTALIICALVAAGNGVAVGFWIGLCVGMGRAFSDEEPK